MSYWPMLIFEREVIVYPGDIKPCRKSGGFNRNVGIQTLIDEVNSVIWLIQSRPEEERRADPGGRVFISLRVCEV